MKTVKLRQLKRLRVPATNGEVIRLDLGCGPGKKVGFIGVDSIAFPGVDKVVNLAEPIYVPMPKEFEHLADCFERKIAGYKPWPWRDNSVEEAHSSHCVEHFARKERIHFFNELYRVLKPGGKCTVIVPHWASCRAYGDMTHEWPAVAEFFWFYLKKEWRMANAPHNDIQWWAAGYTCNFDAVWGYSLEPGVAARNQEYQQFAMQYYLESRQDTICTLTKL